MKVRQQSREKSFDHILSCGSARVITFKNVSNQYREQLPVDWVGRRLAERLPDHLTLCYFLANWGAIYLYIHHLHFGTSDHCAPLSFNTTKPLSCVACFIVLYRCVRLQLQQSTCHLAQTPPLRPPPWTKKASCKRSLSMKSRRVKPVTTRRLPRDS